MQPTTRYAKSGDVRIAYQVFGEGPDLVVAPGYVSHIENHWDEPRFARWLKKVGGICRCIGVRASGAPGFLIALHTCRQHMDELAWTDKVQRRRDRRSRHRRACACLGFSRRLAGRAFRCEVVCWSKANRSFYMARLRGSTTGLRATRHSKG